VEDQLLTAGAGGKGGRGEKKKGIPAFRGKRNGLKLTQWAERHDSLARVCDCDSEGVRGKGKECRVGGRQVAKIQGCWTKSIDHPTLWPGNSVRGVQFCRGVSRNRKKDVVLELLEMAKSELARQKGAIRPPACVQGRFILLGPFGENLKLIFQSDQRNRDKIEGGAQGKGKSFESWKSKGADTALTRSK